MTAPPLPLPPHHGTNTQRHSPLDPRVLSTGDAGPRIRAVLRYCPARQDSTRFKTKRPPSFRWVALVRFVLVLLHATRSFVRPPCILSGYDGILHGDDANQSRRRAVAASFVLVWMVRVRIDRFPCYHSTLAGAARGVKSKIILPGR